MNEHGFFQKVKQSIGIGQRRSCSCLSMEDLKAALRPLEQMINLLTLRVDAALINEIKRIQMTQKELADSLKALTTQSGKIAAEQAARFDTLTAKIKALEDAINAGGDASPEVVTALAELQTAQQSLDDAIPDAPTPA